MRSMTYRNCLSSRPNSAGPIDLGLLAACKSGDPIEIVRALREVAEGAGIGDLVQKTGLTHEALGEAFSDEGCRQFASIIEIARALGYQISLVRIQDERLGESLSAPISPRTGDIPHYISQFWGKARPVEGSGQDWHPMAYHSLDVAASMEALLALRPAWLIANAAASGLPIDEARCRLILAASLHDLGKFAENFQQKVPELFHRLQPDRTFSREPHRHGEIGYAMWFTEPPPQRPAQIKEWMKAAFAHHGAPVVELEAPVRFPCRPTPSP